MAKNNAVNNNGAYWGPVNYMNRFILVPLSSHLKLRRYVETSFKIYPLNVATILDEMEYVQTADQFRFFVSLYLNDAICEVNASLFDTAESPYILIVAKSNRAVNESHLYNMMATGRYNVMHRAQLFSPTKIDGHDYIMHYECSRVSAKWHSDSIACDAIDDVIPDGHFMMNIADDIQQVYTCTITSPDCAPGAIYPEAVNQRRFYGQSDTETEVLADLAALDRAATLSDIRAIVAATTPNIITHIAMDVDTVFRDTVDFAASEFGGMLGTMVENHLSQYMLDPNVALNSDEKMISFNVMSKARSFFDLPYHQLSPFHFCIGSGIWEDDVKFSTIMEYLGRTYSNSGYAIFVNGVDDERRVEGIILPDAPGAVYAKGRFDTYTIEIPNVYNHKIITEEKPRILAATRTFGTLLMARSAWEESMFKSLSDSGIGIHWLSAPITINPARMAHLEYDKPPVGDEIVATHIASIPKEIDCNEAHMRISDIFDKEMGYSKTWKIRLTTIAGEEFYLIGVLASELGSDDDDEEEYTGTLHLQTNLISVDSKIVFQSGNGTLLIEDGSVPIQRLPDKASIPTDNISEPEKPGLVASLLDKIRSKINESKNNESTH